MDENQLRDIFNEFGEQIKNSFGPVIQGQQISNELMKKFLEKQGIDVKDINDKLEIGRAHV